MFGHLKTGLQPHDPKRVAAVPAFHSAVQSEPLLCRIPRDWAQGLPWDGDVLGNDRFGDCGPASAVNTIKLVSTILGQPYPLTEDAALDAYRGLGWDGTFEHDDGVVLLDMMDYWQSKGIGGLVLDCFFRVAFGDPLHLATAVAVGGPLIVGVTLTESCKNTNRWGAKEAADTREWGGHAIMLYSYSAGLYRAKSWGVPIDIEPEYLTVRGNEAYLPMHETMRVPSNVDYIRLLQLAKQLG